MTLRDPTGSSVDFYYVSAGPALSAGIRLPAGIKLPKDLTVVFSPGFSFPPSSRQIFLLDSLPGYDLSRSDITGACILLEASGGAFIGGSGTVMFLGVDPLLVSALLNRKQELAEDEARILLYRALPQANAVLVTYGLDFGLQADVGVDLLLGVIF